tara:strand:- start:410 stop:670 length:261 start_codon:yes stop_codon:yes gene_type:complete
MSNKMDSKRSLIEAYLEDIPIGITKVFTWYATPIGIAASISSLPVVDSDKLLEIAINEGREIALDLSKEENEYYKINERIVFVFYS